MSRIVRAEDPSGPKSSASTTHQKRNKHDMTPEERYDELERYLNPSKLPRSNHKIWSDQDRIAKSLFRFGMPQVRDRPSLRPKVWKLMLGVEDLKVDEYLSYVAKGPSDVSTKIKNDTFRTLATDKQFKGRVNEDMLIRLLEAFVWKNSNTERDGLPFTYVQGMNVLAAPFLYTMPTQIEAFACFSAFIEKCCPLYVQPTLAGVHAGLKLVDRCLEIVDKELYVHLRSKNLSAEIYAFPSVLTLCACTPPLEETLKLWDFLLACGVHLNILCVISQLNLMRDELLAHPSPMKLLRNFPPLQAEKIITNTLSCAAELDEGLYAEIVRHPFER